jgi:c(7)-type cytochrome triheme protein
MIMRLQTIVSLIVLSLLLFIGSGEAQDREDLGREMKMMPPNGPFWEHGNVVMRRKSKKAGMAPVVFPHWSHRAKYTCRVCHLELEFSMNKGETGITREQYLAGKFCGACHDGKTAFTVRDGNTPECDKCHMKDTRPLEKRFNEFAKELPRSSYGNGINWTNALANEMITPINSILSERIDMELPSKLKAPIKMKSHSPRGDVIFSHEVHFAELDCASCHPDIFNIKKRGTKNFDMGSNISRKYCGACHMMVAFPMNDCNRCHVLSAK